MNQFNEAIEIFSSNLFIISLSSAFHNQKT